MAPGATPRRPPARVPPPPVILPPPPEEPPEAERAQDESPAAAAPEPGPEDAREAGPEATPAARRGVPAAAFARIPPSPAERSTAERSRAEPAAASPEQAQPRAIPPGAVQRGAVPPGTIQPSAAQHGASRPPEPSWGTVLATTVRLWTGRRLANPRWRAGLVLVLAAIVFVAAAVPLVLSRGSVGGQDRATQGRSSPSPGAGGLAAAAAARRNAAVWVAQQVSTGAVVSCDPAMCGALEAAHVPSGRLIVLGPGQGDPLGSEVLVATAALRNQFGPRLTSVYAPVVLASFGSGAAQIQIRVIAPDGSGVYMSQLAADVAARKSSGAQMLHNPQLHISPAARGQIAAGYVDPRLLGMLVTLSGQYPVEIFGFGGSPGSNVSVVAPLRSAEIAGVSPGDGQQPASAQVLRSFLSAQRPPYRPSAVTIVRLGSRTVLRVEYPAPTPLGLLGSHG